MQTYFWQVKAEAGTNAPSGLNTISLFLASYVLESFIQEDGAIALLHSELNLINCSLRNKRAISILHMVGSEGGRWCSGWVPSCQSWHWTVLGTRKTKGCPVMNLAWEAWMSLLIWRQNSAQFSIVTSALAWEVWLLYILSSQGLAACSAACHLSESLRNVFSL